MREEFRKTANELFGLPEDAEIEFNGTISTTFTELMICKRLDRIADALEEIAQELGSVNVHLEGTDSIEAHLEKLADCVGYIPPNPYQKEGCSIFRIEGSMYNE